MTDKPLCIYHGNCVDGFGAAWVVRKSLGESNVDFHPGVHGQEPPVTKDRDVIIVDFSYKRPVLEEMARWARSVLILDHHKTAAEDLAGLDAPADDYGRYLQDMLWREAQNHIEGKRPILHALFDMNRSGAGLTWDFFFPGFSRPKLIDHIEDRDLWRFALPMTRDLHGALASHPYDFATWDDLVAQADDNDWREGMAAEGKAIHRKLLKDIAELLGVVTRRMVIGGVSVPVANLPYMMASEAGNIMAVGQPFAATYCDGAEGRLFSLRSDGAAGVDVSAIAKRYGGGGHRNAAGFRVPIGWEGDGQ